MEMPKTSIDKYDGTIAGKYYIGLSWQVFGMEAIAEAFRKQCLSYQEFRLCVLALDG